MPRGRPIAACLAALTAALLGLGCGSSDSGGADIPPETAAAINAKLDEVEKRFEDGKCEGSGSAESSLGSLREAVDGELLADADEGFVADLNELLDHLAGLISEKCNPEDEEEPTTDPTTTETTDTVPETTDTVPETTETTETTTTTTDTTRNTTTTTTTEPPNPPTNPGGGVVPGGGNDRAAGGPGSRGTKQAHGHRNGKERSR
jgi:hypothetical protein